MQNMRWHYWKRWSIFRSSHPSCFMKKGVLGNFTKFTGKHLCQSLFFNKVAGLQLYWKIDSGTGVLLWILWNFQEHLLTEHIRVTASIFSSSMIHLLKKVIIGIITEVLKTLGALLLPFISKKQLQTTALC